MMTENRGRLIVFSAPSGCGKGTMLKYILRDGRFYCSVSATTRKPRNSERDGVNYYFLEKEDFLNKVENGEFLEYAEYCGNFYGTLLSEVETRLEKGVNVILEIEVQGAMKIRQLRPDALFVFVAPPSLGELERRLRKRGTETDDVIAQRIAKASEEIALAKNYDYIIVNAQLEKAVEDFFTIVRAESLRAKNSAYITEEVIKNA